MAQNDFNSNQAPNNFESYVGQNDPRIYPNAQKKAQTQHQPQSIIPTPIEPEPQVNETITEDIKKTSAIPTFNVVDSLPSKCLSYPEGFEISYRPYSFGESKKLSQSKLSVKEHIDFVLNGVNIKGLKSKYDLTYADFLFISLLRRISTVETPTVNISFPCKKCNTPNTFQLSIDDLEFQDSELPKLPIKVSIKGKELKFTYFTLAHYIEAQKANKLQDNMYMLAKSCFNLPFKEAYNIITDPTLSFDDGSVLDLVEVQLFHGLKPKEYVCQNGECGEINLIQPEIEKMVISPFRDEEGSIRDRISYGD